LTTCLASIVGPTGQVVAIDHIPELIELAKSNLKKQDVDLEISDRIKFHVADGNETQLASWPRMDLIM